MSLGPLDYTFFIGLAVVGGGIMLFLGFRLFTPEEPDGPAPVTAGMVTLKTGTTIRGAIVEHSTSGLRLRNAAMGQVNPQSRRIEWQPLSADTLVTFDNIDFWQEGFDPSILSVS